MLPNFRIVVRCRLLAAVVLAGAVLFEQAEGRRAPSRAFLQKELPLNIVLTTPVDLATDGSSNVFVTGRQALTAVFSRPVIALGSDFSTPDAQQKLPFRLSCGLPGKFRWVTTTIARFDPDVDWPTDLDCKFQWVTSLTSYDGVRLRLGGVPAERSLVTNPLAMYMGGVTSETALDLTDGIWSSYASDNVYEVPPDGKILLHFTHPVHLVAVQSALEVIEGATGGGTPVPFHLGPCQSAARWLMPIDTELHGSITSPLGLSLDVNATCVEISLRSPLKPATPYHVQLLAGRRYHALAGPLRQDISVSVSGLRPFKILFEKYLGEQTERGTRFRRLDLWLPHGLSTDTPPQALARQISLCELNLDETSCSAVAFNLSLPIRGLARLSVPLLKPSTKYRITITGSSLVKDGYDQHLQDSELTFWTTYVMYDASAPSFPSTTAILEPGAETLQTWPVVTRSHPSGGFRNYSAGAPRIVQGWELDLSVDRIKAYVIKMVFQRFYFLGFLETLFGPPTVSLDPSALKFDDGEPDWMRLELPLRDGETPSRARLVSICCEMGDHNSYAKLLLNTSLSLNIVVIGQKLTAWVLDTATASHGPVWGALVSVFTQPYDGYTSVPFTDPDPVQLANCTTGADGMCTITVPSNASLFDMYAFAEARGNFAALEEVGWVRAPSMQSRFVASLVADRRLVVPGDSLKVTGFVQQATASGLQPPHSSYVALTVSPSWDGSEGFATSSPGGVLVRPGRGLMDTSSGSDTLDMSVLGTQSPLQALMANPMRMTFTAKLDSDAMQADADSVSAPAAVFFAKLDGATGTFHGEIPVPVGARVQPYTIRLAMPTSGDTNADPNGPVPADAVASSWRRVPDAEFPFTVADPRPPTAELKLETTPWTNPSGVVVVNVTAVSYIGASVDNSEVTLTWRHAKAAGVLTMLTDVAGFASTSINLGALPEANRTTLYDKLTVDAEWIGPTRERIFKSTGVILADGPARLSLELSLTTDVPGMSFSVAANLTSNVDGLPLYGLPVNVTLRPATNDSAAGTLCNAIASCAIVSGTGFDPACQLALPCVGHFGIEACVDTDSGIVCTQLTRGRNVSQWAMQPRSDHPSPSIFPDKTSYKIGDSPQLRFQNPWPNGQMVIFWGNDFRSTSQLVYAVDNGFTSVTIGPLGDECVGGCSVVAVVAVPRLDSNAVSPLPPPEELAVSRLFDPLAPHTFTMSTVLDVRPDNALGVSLSVVSVADADAATTIRDVDGNEVLAIAPGEEAQVTVSVKSGLAENASIPEPGSVEVTVYGVDKAFLDLMPYDLPHPEQQMLLRLAADIQVYGMDAYRLAPGAVQAVFNKLMARLSGVDPWLPFETSVKPEYGLSPVDMSDEKYVQGFTTALTYLPAVAYYTANAFGQPAVESSREVVPTAMGVSIQAMASAADFVAADAPSNAAKKISSDDNGGGAAAAAVSIRQESDFVVTPLFKYAKTDAEGRVFVTFVAPPNLGTFVIRAFAAAGQSARYGSGESKLAVRRRLSLTPSVPRFVRVGDRFEAGAVVTVGDTPANVTVTLSVKDPADSPLTLQGDATKELRFGNGGGLQQEVRFSFTANAVGSATLILSASNDREGVLKDGLQLEIPVHGQQGDVWVATSFALNGGAAQWQEGMDLPPAVPGSGGLSLTAGVGNFPAISTVYDNLLLAEKDRTQPLAIPAMLWATLPAVLSYYGESTSSEQSTTVNSSFADLRKLTSSEVGLQYSEPSRWGGWLPTRTDINLNAWALFLAAQHGSTLASGVTTASSEWADLASYSLPTWRKAVERQLVADASEARAQPPGTQQYSDWYSLAWTRLVLGAQWTPQQGSDVIKRDLSLDALIKGANATSSLTIRLVTALVLQSLAGENPAPKLLTAVLNQVTSALRTQGRTAYVAETAGSAAAASLNDQALSLLLLTRAGANHQLLPKLAAYVSSPSAGRVYSIFVIQPSFMEQGLAVAALSEYDKSRGSSKPDVELVADANGLTVLKAAFHTGGDLKPVTNTTAWEDIPEPQGPEAHSTLNFQVDGAGEVSVAASLHFIPASLLSYPVYRGLYVEAALQMLDPLTGSPMGPRLSAVPLGSVVSYTVQVTTPDDLGAVTLSVMMPGGLEPLDPNVAPGMDRSCDASWVDSWAWGHFFRWWWPICPAQETRPSEVTFSYMALRAGTSSVTIRAVAATPGTFVVPPVRASVDSQPELMGSTAAGKITVCANCGEPKYITAIRPPSPCPNECSGRGTCNLKSGRCSCDAGFGRSDCSRPVA